MERALKERIIGAVVLVVFVVLVVPIFLDGPPDDGEIVSERVLLPGQEDQKTQTVVLDRDRTDPVPAATTAAPKQTTPTPQQPVREEPQLVVTQQESPPPSEPEPAPREPEPKVTPKPATTQPAASTTGMWAVSGSAFNRRHTSIPSSPGIITSSRTRSGAFSFANVRAVGPSSALTTS